MPPERYVHGHHDSVLRSHRWRTGANSAGYLLGHLRPGQRLLDVGCGPATISVDLAAAVAPGEVVAVDRAEAALAAARDTVAEQGATNVTVAEGDVYALDHADASFDVVHVHQVLHHLADPVAAIVELTRVCRPGGLLALREVDYPAMAWFPEDDCLERWLALFLAVSRAAGGEPAAGRRLLHWARCAGVHDITPSASAWCFATVEDRAWWGDTWAERVTSSSFAEQALAGHAGQAELREIAAAWRRWAARDDGWFLLPHGEVLCRTPPS